VLRADGPKRTIGWVVEFKVSKSKKKRIAPLYRTLDLDRSSTRQGLRGRRIEISNEPVAANRTPVLDTAAGALARRFEIQEDPMSTTIKPGWSKPSTILFATEIPVNEKAFAVAVAQAAEFGAELILFHAYDTSRGAATQSAGIHEYAIARAEKRRFEPHCQRARDFGIHCRVVVRPGLAADQILSFLRGRRIDRVVMGAHSPGPIGKLLVGSVAEAVLRGAGVPVCIVGPNVVESTYRNSVNRNILCHVSKQQASRVVACFGAELASRHNAGLMLQQIIPPQERSEQLADRTIDQIEAELPSLVPVKFQHKVRVRSKVALGDPTEELLHEGRAQQANLIVMDAQGASHFAAITHAGMVYKVLAYAHCPVITLSPVVLAECGANQKEFRPFELNYMAGVI
jgi:nucleotide-binding universal stress UspA family protein